MTWLHPLRSQKRRCLCLLGRPGAWGGLSTLTSLWLFSFSDFMVWEPGRHTAHAEGPGWCSTLLLLSSNSQPLKKVLSSRPLLPLLSHSGFFHVSHLPLPSSSKDACHAFRAHPMVTRITFCLKILHLITPAKLFAT